MLALTCNFPQVIFPVALVFDRTDRTLVPILAQRCAYAPGDGQNQGGVIGVELRTAMTCSAICRAKGKSLARRTFPLDFNSVRASL